MTREQAVDIVRASCRARLGGWADEVVGMLRPCVCLRARRAGDPPVGASRFGGLPDVPAGFAWPRYEARRLVGTDEAGKKAVYSEPFPAALDFLAQVRLRDAAPFDASGLLPAEGMLYFFYDRRHGGWGFEPGDKPSWRVLYHAGAGELVRTPPPPGADDLLPSEPCELSFEASFTLPRTLRAWAHGSGDLLEIDYAGYRGPLDGIDRARTAENADHHLLGHPSGPLQDDPEQTAESMSHSARAPHEGTAGGADEWLPLLQVDTDEEGPGWMWVDCGTLYFMIRKSDLAAHRFDDVWLYLMTA